MKMMATVGKLIANSTCRRTIHHWIEDGVKAVTKFAYKLPFDWHFCYCHTIDDHNNLPHSLPSIEESLITWCWECHVFLILATIKVNAFLCICYAKGMETFPSLVNFCRHLGWQMVLHPHLMELNTMTSSMCLWMVEMILLFHQGMLLSTKTVAGHALQNRGTSSACAQMDAAIG